MLYSQKPGECGDLFLPTLTENLWIKLSFIWFSELCCCYYNCKSLSLSLYVWELRLIPFLKKKHTHSQINCENCGKAESFELQKCVFEWLCAGFEALLCTTVINWPGSCHGMKLCKEINRWVTSEAMYWLQKTHLNLLSPLHGDCVLKPVRFEAWNWVYFYEFSPNSSH